MQYITGDRKKGLVHCYEFSAGHVKGWLTVEREKSKPRPHLGYCGWVSDWRYWRIPFTMMQGTGG